MVTKKSMWKVEFGAGGRTKVETAFFTDGRDALSFEKAVRKRGEAVYARFKLPHDPRLGWMSAPEITGKMAWGG